MSRWSRLTNVFRGDRVTRDIDEELASHLEEAVAEGRDPDAARRAFGSSLRHREASRDVKLTAWLEALRADGVFGWRRLRKHPVTSLAAVLSLALAIGACLCAFRLIDAMLLRQLPVAHPEQLYAMSRQQITDGKPGSYDECEYPLFVRMREAVRGAAELVAITAPARLDLTYASDHDMEKAHVQYVSGWMFDTFGLTPRLGRLLTTQDDITPGAHPYAVISYDYWTRRFGQDPQAIGRTFRMEGSTFEIVGVSAERFTGTETGTMTDVFVPTMMRRGQIHRSDWSWFRTWVQVKPGVALEPVRERMQAALRAHQESRLHELFNLSEARRARFLGETVLLHPGATGASSLQRDFRRPLIALGVLVVLVLLIACVNVANLMTAQASSRAREMALRVSIGAGRWRLVQLVLVESIMLAVLSATLAACFAWWATPIVVGLINTPDNPARLVLPTDGRVIGFGVLLAFGVTALFGLVPALRASAVTPVHALKGGADPHASRRVMHAAIGLQVAFCVLVQFAAGLFVATFDRLAHQPHGFDADRVLTLDAIAEPAQPPALWDQVADRLRAMPGVESVAMAGWSLMSGNSWNGFVSVHGAPPTDTLTFFLAVSPGWIDTMKVRLLAGRDFHASDAHPSVAIVNETFAKEYFGGEHPIGRHFERAEAQGRRVRYEIIGVTRDARYRGLRGPIPPTAYVPFAWKDAGTGLGSGTAALQAKRVGTFLVRTSEADPLSLATILRREVGQARAEFRVTTIRTQQSLVDTYTVRERLLATLASFFAVVALVLAAVGLYGVLDYSVLQRRREIGIRLALGAHAGNIARRVTASAFSVVLAGAVAGLALGLASMRHVEALFYEVKATDPLMIAFPWVTILAAALIAAVLPVLRALRVDPIETIRAD